MSSIKVARLNVTDMSFMGFVVKLNDTFRLGAVTIEVLPKSMIVMSSATWSSLVSEHTRGGVTPILDALEAELGKALGSMKTSMVDLSVKSPRKVVDRRRVTRYSDDRVDYVCSGIGDLVAQMSNLLGMATCSEGSVTSVAKRYAELATEMKGLREAVTRAEGQFEVAQQLVVQLMGRSE